MKIDLPKDISRSIYPALKQGVTASQIMTWLEDREALAVQGYTDLYQKQIKHHHAVAEYFIESGVNHPSISEWITKSWTGLDL